MTRIFSSLTPRALLAALFSALTALALAGCQPAALDDLMQGRKIEYQGDENQQGRRLEHPPDLISDALTREGDAAEDDESGVSLSEYRVGDVPEIEEEGDAAPAAAESAQPAVLRGAGNLQWLESELSPDDVWPVVRKFWDKRMGFALERDEPKLGFMETDWLDLRARRGFGFAGILDDWLERVRDSGQRDKFRTRIDPADEGQGSRIYIAHRHVTEVYDLRSQQAGRSGFQGLPPDPHLEAEMLRRMMLYLSGEELPEEDAGEEDAASDESETVAAADADADAGAEAGEAGEEGEGEEGEEGGEDEDAPEIGEDYELRGDSLLIKKPLRDAFLLVRIGLDRGGFTLEDRDVSEAAFYIRHSGGPESDRIFGASESGFFNKLFVRAEPVVRDIKIQLTEEEEHSAVRAEAADDEGDLTAEQSEALLRLLAENLP